MRILLRKFDTINIMNDSLDAQIKELEEKQYALNQEAYYLSLKKEGFSDEAIEHFKQEDHDFLKNAQQFASHYQTLKTHFFGYPGNLTNDTPLISRLRKLESSLFYINNAGDPFERGDNSMDGKVYEQELIHLFFKRYNLDPQTSWGYITSGGSESNQWAIRAAYAKFEKARFYFSKASHYSIQKALTVGTKDLFPYTVVDVVSAKHEAIDVEKLLKIIRLHYTQDQEVPLLLLTWGTTQLGSLDDVKSITQSLRNENIPYYCHVDAAFYGGIPLNQIEAPVCPSLEDLGADSISISFHKFFGVPDINSIVLSRHKVDGQWIDYLGHHDTTVSGSRTFSIFSATKRIKEVWERSPQDWYIRNVRWMEEALKRNSIDYHRDDRSNIFVISKPSEAFLKKYHLASFGGKSKTMSLSHFIVNPFHTLEELKQFVDDLKQETRKSLDL